MEYRTMGRSGLHVSRAGVGCNTFGWWIEADQAKRVVDAALDNGITLFDTADMYDDGRSETFLGKALGQRRNDAVIVTKFGMKKGSDQRDIPRGSRAYIIESCEGSLKRLGTDHIDLYLHHQPDPMTPVEETLDAMNRLIAEGKIRYAGCSNYAGWQIADAHWLAQSGHLNGFVVAQNEWNLLERDIETDVVPACRHYGMGIMPFFPLSMGLLSGKYKRGEQPSGDNRLGGDDDRYRRLLSHESFDRIDKLAAFAAEHGHSLLELAIGWLASQDVVSTVICGATKPEQVQANAAAVTAWRLTADDMAAVDGLLSD
jgi:aryl-alcohol dehydrogenase-like predicted oxidoreductase